MSTTNVTNERTLGQLAREAMDVQNACNPFALAAAYHEALADLVAVLRYTGQSCCTDDLCRHPINQLWVSKLHCLAGMGLSCAAAFSSAWNRCRQLAETD